MKSQVAGKLSPLMPYPGGQSREAKRLAKFFPKHETYVEPFVGGGSFFFYKEPSKKEVIGDTSGWVIDFYKKVKKGDLRRCQSGFKATQAEFNKHLRSKTACSVVARQAMSFAGKGKTFKTKQFANRKLIYKKKLNKDNLSLYEKRLKKATLVKTSFEKTMRQHDSAKTWHLLDPPWPGVATTRAYDGDQSVTPEQVAKVAKAMKGKVWVLYNETPEVKKAFPKSKGWHIYRLNTRVSSGNGSVKYKKVLITNRPLPGKPTDTRKLQGLATLNGLGELDDYIATLEEGVDDVDAVDSDLGMTERGLSIMTSIAIAGAVVAIRRCTSDKDRTVPQIAVDVVQGTAVFWVLGEVVSSVIRGLAGKGE